jgi:phage regulator Rha-like protein
VAKKEIDMNKVSNGLHLIQEHSNVFCDSRELAKQFDKTHDKILKDIAIAIRRINKIEEIEHCCEFFIPVRSGTLYKLNKSYKITFKGFIMLTLKYVNPKAVLTRLRFVNFFELLLKNIALQLPTTNRGREWLEFKCIHRTVLTEAIKKYVVNYRREVEGDMDDGKYYIYYSNLVNKAVGFKVPITQDGRYALDARRLHKVAMVEQRIADRITDKAKEGVHYKTAYKHIKAEIAFAH